MVQLWDTSGDAKSEHITSAYFSSGYHAIHVFDLTRRDRFESLRSRTLPMRRWASERVRLLVGTRADEGAAVVGLAEEARAFAAERGWEFVQISAKADRRGASHVRYGKWLFIF